ncbi:NAD+ synthase [Bartonella senegalensis]|uniref:NAD+ synthase n=1 Tax=Bartonella senegalensis TaxID=1468418 RepID=UPI0009D9255F|nr:NAD+ synthase [Bartonella senegalensis]
MKNDFRVAIAQLNPIVGDIEGNFSLAVRAHQKAQEEGADLVLFTELFISAYPPEDLVLKPAFTQTCEDAVKKLAKVTKRGPGIIIGLPLRYNNNIYNGVVLLDEGQIVAESLKFDLPNYAEFDEKRVFSSGPRPEPIVYHGLKLGIVICEDIWNDFSLCAELANKGAEIVLTLNGSPYQRDKTLKRIEVVRAQALQSGLPVIYANQVGGQDELVFDGGSFALDGQGKMVFQMKHFESHIALSYWQRKAAGWQCVFGPNETLLNGLAADYQACVLGLRDYVDKNRFQNVILGLSGGIDSALCTAMAVDALGAEKVRSIMMPYHYTSQESLEDAKECAHLLGCHYEIIPIAQPVEVFLKTMAPFFLGLPSDVTEENLQSRIRGVILMALSNKFGSMLVTTGNKSEMAVGYATLYGDMNGGFNPLKDIYKTQVYKLAQWRNQNHLQNLKGPKGIAIPPNIIAKAPSAELRENQKDEDSLPPYSILDDILQSLIEDDMSVCDIIKRGYLRETVEKIEHLLYGAEYKRRQSAPGVKISSKNFGRDRRYPIVNRFRDNTK